MMRAAPPAALSIGQAALVAAGLAAAARFDLLPAAAGASAFALLALAAYRRPDRVLIALVCTAILVPVEAAVQVGGLPRIGPTRLLLAAFLLGWLGRALLRREFLPRIGSRWVAAALGLYVAATAASVAASVALRASLFMAAGHALEQLAPFLAMGAFLGEPDFWPRLRRALLLTALLVGLLGLTEALVGENPLLPIFPGEEPAYRGGWLRIRATLFHPIALGCLLNLLWPYAAAEALAGRPGPARWAATALLGLMAAALFLTVSRGPWAAAAIQLALLFFCLPGDGFARLRYALVAGAALAGALFALAAFGPEAPLAESALINPGRIRLERVDEASSEHYRLALLEAVWDRLTGERWLVGLGPGTFHLAGIESTYAGHRHVLTAADSHVAKLLAETGLFGLGAFALLCAAAAAEGWRAVRRTAGAERARAAAAFAALLGFLFANLTASMFLVFPLGILFGMSAAIGIRTAQRAAGARGHERPAG